MYGNGHGVSISQCQTFNFSTGESFVVAWKASFACQMGDFKCESKDKLVSYSSFLLTPHNFNSWFAVSYSHGNDLFNVR